MKAQFLGIASPFEMSTFRAPDGLGLLPGPDSNLLGPFISTFGILSMHKADVGEICHFCLEHFDEGSTVLKLWCCGHSAHTACFNTWAFHAIVSETAIRCAYCRTVYDYTKKCFLCLEELEEDQPKKYTSCCNSVVHSACADALTTFRQMPFTTENVTYECGQLIGCWCLWEKP